MRMRVSVRENGTEGPSHDLRPHGFTRGDFDTSIWTARCRSASAHQTSGVDGHEVALPMGTPTVSQVAGRLVVAPRPPDRRRRSGACGRGRERPTPSDASIGIGEDRHGTCPCHPPRRVRSRPSVPRGKAFFGQTLWVVLKRPPPGLTPTFLDHPTVSRTRRSRCRISPSGLTAMAAGPSSRLTLPDLPYPSDSLSRL